MMLRSKLVKSFILGLSLSVVFSAAAFAEVDRDQEAKDQEIKIQIEQVGTGSAEVTGVAPDAPVSSDGNTSSAYNPVDEALYQMQSEIDRLLFGTHKEELARKGITVTHTGAVSEYVEVGITPFSEDHAAYISKLLNGYEIKVVEGFLAIPYSDGAEGGEELMYATGAPVDEVPEGEAPVEDADIVLSDDEVKIVSVTDESVSASVNQTLPAALITGIAAAVLAVLGGILAVVKKMKAAA